MCNEKRNNNSNEENLNHAFDRLGKRKLRSKDIDAIGVYIEEVTFIGILQLKGIKITLLALTILFFTISLLMFFL